MGSQFHRLALLGDETTTNPGIEHDPTGRATGRIWRADDWLRGRLRDAPPSLRRVGHELASYGVTHLSDATAETDGVIARLISHAVENGDVPQHVAVMGTLAPSTRHPRLTLGPVKPIVAEHQLPHFDEFCEQIRAARSQNRSVAVHCVTREALAFTLAALDSATGRRGDRIEHCAVIDLSTAQVVAQRRLRVITQPMLIARRRDAYRRSVDESDLPDPWRYASLLQAGVTVAPSSDAPTVTPTHRPVSRPPLRDGRLQAGLSPRGTRSPGPRSCRHALGTRRSRRAAAQDSRRCTRRPCTSRPATGRSPPRHRRKLRPGDNL